MTGVYVGCPAKPTGYRFVEPIPKFYDVEAAGRQYYLTPRPVIVVDRDGRCFSADRSEIVEADESRAVARVGRYFKIPVEYIAPLSAVGGAS